MDALSPADPDTVRLVAVSLNRLDIQDAWGRLRFAPRTSNQRVYHDILLAAARRKLVLNLASAHRCGTVTGQVAPIPTA